ncbi:MAG: ABC transporter permease, partial [Clostridiales Family XIII bacterium]|nr:ABC transporter permease [Clostridiales Family XIII bacterium]
MRKGNRVGTLFTPMMAVAAAILLLIIVCTVFAGLIAPYDPEAIDLSISYGPATPEHILGTDNVGRDNFSRLLFGGRTAITNAFLVIGITVAAGIPLGLLCGYFGGVLDAVVMRVWDIILSFPPLLLGFIFVAAFGRGSSASVIALGIAWIPMISRLSRNLTMAEKTQTYVLAAKSMKYSDARIVFRHILPNCVSTLLAELTVDVGYAIIVLASLSFLGLGVQPPTSDWGLMLQEALVYVRQSPLQT